MRKLYPVLCCISLLLIVADGIAQKTTPLPPPLAAVGSYQMNRGGQRLQGTQYMKGNFNSVGIVKWKATLTVAAGGAEAEPAIGDIDNDGKNDIVCSINNGDLMVFDGTTGANKWTLNGAGGQTSAVIADANGDGKMDLAIANSSMTLRNGANGAVIWSYTPPNQKAMGIASCPNVSDLDGDGIPEVVFVNNNVCYALNGMNGAIKWQCSVGPPSTFVAYTANGTGPAIGDLNGDGVLDVVASLMNGAGVTLVAIDGKTGTPLWTVASGATPSFAQPFPAIGDVDGDCKLDVVYNGGAINGQTGAVMWGNPGGNGAKFMVLADLDDDCVVEAVTSCAVYNAKTGAVKWQRSSCSNSGWFAPAPKVGDFVPSSPGKEIITNGAYNVNTPLSMYNGSTGALIWSFNMAAENHTSEGVCVADVDNDGCVEIVVMPDCCNGSNTLMILDDNGNTANCGILASIDQVDFLPADTISCNCVNPRDFSSACANSWQWSFPGGTPSTANVKNPGTVCYNNVPGNYNITMIAKRNNCAAWDTVVHTLTIKPCNPVVTINGSAICPGNCATLTAIPVAGVAPYTYSWSGGGIPPGPNPGPFSVCPTVTTIYTVTITDSTGKTATDTATIVVYTPPVANAGNDISICKGKSGTLTGSGGGTYSWTPANDLSCTTCPSPVATPLNSTSYFLTVTDNHGCTSRDSVNVIVNPLPTVSAGADQMICPGTTTTLTPSGASTYSWLPDPTLSCSACTNPVASPASGSVTYTVVGTDPNGCTGTAQVTVTVSSAMSVFAGPDQSVCPGGSATINVTAPGATTYLWNPSTGLSCNNCPNPIATPSATTTYIVGASNGMCSGADTITIVVFPPAVADAGPDQSICPGKSANLSASGGTTYTWTFDPSLNCTSCPNPVATPSATTIYTVVATDANGCTDDDQVTVTVFPGANIFAGVTDTICTGTSTTLSPTGGVSYQWTPDPSLNCTACTNPVASPTTTITYTVTGTDANGCTGTSTVTVIVNTKLNVTASGGQSICAGSNTTLSVNAPGATSYTWSPATGLSCTSCTNPVATPGTTTTYTISAANNFCSGSDVVTVIVNPLPVADAGQDVAICSGASTILNASGGISYTWTPATGLNNVFTANPSANPSTTTTYHVTVSNGPCTASDSVTVTVNPLPTITASPSTTICNGNSTTLNANGGVSYVWSPATGLSNPNGSSTTANPAATITYDVTGTDLNGCTNKTSVTVSVVNPPVPDAGTDKNICQGQSTQLIAKGGMSYLWTPSTGLSNDQVPNPTATPAFTTTYTVAVSTQAPCVPAFDTVTVFVHPIPTVNAGIDTSMIAGQSVVLNGSGTGYSYMWYPSVGLSCTNCLNPIASPLLTTTYILTTVDSFGCRNRDTLVIYVEDILTLYVPNAFTPRGINNIYYAFGVGIHEFEFYVFNRWGEKVFETNDPNIGWDGTFKGQPVQEDVYVYLAKARSVTGKSITRTGPVTVLYY